MAFHRFFRAILEDEEIALCGDGGQTRDFTFISDIVRATVAAAFRPLPGGCTVLNIGSGMRLTLREAIDLIGEISGRTPRLRENSFQHGDMSDTLADISLAGNLLGYSPRVSLHDGLAAEYDWITHRAGVPQPA